MTDPSVINYMHGTWELWWYEEVRKGWVWGDREELSVGRSEVVGEVRKG